VISFSPYHDYLASSGDVTFGTAVMSVLFACVMVWLLGILELLRKRFRLTLLGFFLTCVSMIVAFSFLIVLLLHEGWWQFCIGLLVLAVMGIALKIVFLDASPHQGQQLSQPDGNEEDQPPGLKIIENMLSSDSTELSKNTLKNIFWNKEQFIAEEKQNVRHAKEIARTTFFESEQTRLNMKKIKHLLEIEDLNPRILKQLFGEDTDTEEESNLDDMLNEKEP